MFSTIIFDLGGVLIDWNPRYLYRKIFDTEQEIDQFLEEVCTPAWNEQQDAGRSLKTATELLVSQFPGQRKNIEAYYDRWTEMLGGSIQGTVDILEEVANANRHQMLALTNWSAETIPTALRLYPFFKHFEGIVVSGKEKLIKPDPRLYQVLLERYSVEAEKALFIDDSIKNIKAAEDLGIHGVHFENPQQLRSRLVEFKIL